MIKSLRIILWLLVSTGIGEKLNVRICLIPLTPKLVAIIYYPIIVLMSQVLETFCSIHQGRIASPFPGSWNCLRNACVFCLHSFYPCMILASSHGAFKHYHHNFLPIWFHRFQVFPIATAMIKLVRFSGTSVLKNTFPIGSKPEVPIPMVR